VIVLLAGLLALATPLLLGGDLRRLAAVRLRAVPWLLAGLGVQTLVVEVPMPRPPAVAGHLASYAVAAWFVLVNRRLAGLPVVAAGAASNALVIALNGGVMPASAAARHLAGLRESTGFVNSGPVAHPALAFLGDVFAVPAPVPLANVFSVGDVLIVLGAGLISCAVCGTRWTTPRSSPTAPGPPALSSRPARDRDVPGPRRCPPGSGPRDRRR